MGLYEEGAINRQTAAILALAETIERHRLDQAGHRSTPTDAKENVQDRFEKHLRTSLDTETPPKGDE